MTNTGGRSGRTFDQDNKIKTKIPGFLSLTNTGGRSERTFDQDNKIKTVLYLSFNECLSKTDYETDLQPNLPRVLLVPWDPQGLTVKSTQKRLYQGLCKAVNIPHFDCVFKLHTWLKLCSPLASLEATVSSAENKNFIRDIFNIHTASSALSEIIKNSFNIFIGHLIQMAKHC